MVTDETTPFQGPPMIDASYFRQKALECIRLSYASPDEHVAAKLIAMAEEFEAKADELDATSKEREAL